MGRAILLGHAAGSGVSEDATERKAGGLLFHLFPHLQRVHAVLYLSYEANLQRLHPPCSSRSVRGDGRVRTASGDAEGSARAALVHGELAWN